MYRTQDDRPLKQAVFGIMNDKNKRGRPKRRWMNDLVDWCNKDIGTKSLRMLRIAWLGHVQCVRDARIESLL